MKPIQCCGIQLAAGRGVLLTLMSCALTALFLTGCTGTPPQEPAPAVASAPVLPERTKPAEADPPAYPSLLDKVKKSAETEPAPFDGEGWRSLHGGGDLSGWQEVSFAGGGEVEVGEGIMLLNMGTPFTGVRWTNQFATTNYEIAFDAMRVMGTDFFCGLTVPFENSHCTLVLGGWGGSLVGISSINGLDASENETTKFMNFEKMRWYRVRLRATKDRIEAWIDNDKIVNVVTKNDQISLRPGEIELCKPLGIASWQTAAAFRRIQWRAVEGPADPPPKRL